MNTQPNTSELDFCSAILCIELDTQSEQFTAQIPPLLTHDAANYLADAIAEDLQRSLEKGITGAGLVLAGALYEQTDIFRPGFPLLAALAQAMREEAHQNGLPPPRLAIGTATDNFSISALNPQPHATCGALALLPFCLVAPVERLDEVFTDLDNHLTVNEVSAQTRAVVETLFEIPVLNLFYATLGDLCAWLRTELESNNLQGLWQLLSPALFERPGPHQVILNDSGNRYMLAADQAWSAFYTFNDWAQFGPGRNLEAQQLENAYLYWLRQFRLYAVALPNYGLPLHIVRGVAGLESDDVNIALESLNKAPLLTENYVLEVAYTAVESANPATLLVTAQGNEGLEVIAYSIATLTDDKKILRIEHFYPLNAAGIDEINAEVQERAKRYKVAYTIEQPGWLVYSPSERCLGVLDENKQWLNL